uniref:Uncharacterized protein n=1 Tax=Glossina palpalis gambiensis TaxID=67801 RepID=A0A1B0ALX4_9MUSC
MKANQKITTILSQYERDNLKKPRKLSLPAVLPTHLHHHHHLHHHYHHNLSQHSPLSTINSPFGPICQNPKTEPTLAFSLPTKPKKASKTTRRIRNFLKAATSAATTNSPHQKSRRKSSAASIVETALAAAGVSVNLTNASASSASATELLATTHETASKSGDYPKTPTPASNCDNNSGGATGGPTASATLCSGINFLVYMVCSFCCCCYNFRNSPTSCVLHFPINVDWNHSKLK